ARCMGMTTQTAHLVYDGVPAATLRSIRASACDQFGNVLFVRTAAGGEPLRCCLRLARAGDSIALIAFQPAGTGGPYAEIGPLFIHTEPCAEEPSRTEFPADFRDRRAVLRPYDADGQMLDGVLAESGESERLLPEMFADPAVQTVQVRNVIAGCWNFTVRRAADAEAPPDSDQTRK
ncbi:MAG: DUF1203 domain-containing protein, partial [Actinomycetota bacterium]